MELRQRKDIFRRCLSSLLTLALTVALVPISPPAAAFAASDVAGGADLNPPSLVLNDHTAYAIHYSMSGLSADTVLGVNVRLSATGTSGGFSDARGFTWSPSLSRWVHTREAAANFPTVATDASGNASGWVYWKCGDDTFTGFGTGHAPLAEDQAYLTVSLQTPGGSGTYNGSDKCVVRVVDAKTQGAWVHNGVATGAAAAKRAEALKSDDASVTYSVQKTEANTLDDDSNGAVDDEEYGPAGATGDFRLGVPATSTLNVKLNQTGWAPGQGVSSGPADSDIALGAADQTAPGAPSGLTAIPGNGRVTLNWSAPGDGDVSSYRVYRLVTGAYGDQALQTPVPTSVATVAAPATSFTETGLANGIGQTYFVRAVDADTNVSPRSNAAAATPVALDIDAPSAVSDLLVGSVTADSVNLTWTAPGDDVAVGTASAYDVRYSASPIPDDSAFAAATEAVGEPSPQVAGSAEGFSATGLATGTHYYFALKTRDEAGNWSGLSNSVEATPEASSAGTMSVNSGAEFTTTRAVTINSDVSGAVDMRVRDAAGAWSAWRPYAAETTLTLTAGDGLKTVEAEYRNAGNAITSLSDTITLDSTGPDGMVVINGGDLVTLQSAVTLACSASDTNGVAWMRCSTDGVFDTEATQTLAATCLATLSSGNGPKTVWVQYADTLGNVSTCSDSIVLNGPSWTISTAPGIAGQIYDVSFADVDNGWAFGGAGKIAHTTDGGASWTAQSIGVGTDLRGGWALSTSTVVAATSSNGEIYRSTNGGANWTLVKAAMVPNQGLQRFLFLDSTTGWVVGNQGRIFKTTDGGANWTAQTSGTTATLWRIAFAPDGQTGWVTGQNGAIRKTTDGGASWTAQTSGSSNARISGLSVVDSQTAFACSSQNSLVWWKTTNGGTTWTSSVIEAGVTYYDCKFLDANNGWVVGHTAAGVGRIYRTTNGGASWTTELAEGSQVFSMCALDATHAWAGSASKTAKYCPPDFTAPFAVSDLAVTGVDAAGVHLGLTAPGDDGAAGTASAYDLRCSATPITNDAAFDAATQVSGIDVPAAAGALQSLAVTGLAPDTHYYFALKTRDEVMNFSALSNSVDATTPSAPAGTMTVAGGAPISATLAVSISSTVTGAVDMRVRETGGSWSTWQPYAGTLPFTLSAGDAEKTVEVEYRNAVGTLSLSDAITLDQTGPSGTITIDGGDAATNQAAALLTLFATDSNGVTRMRLSNDGTFDTEPWEIYAATHGWGLSAGDGEKTVWVQYEDSVGNVSTYSDTIDLDATAPTVSDDAPAGWSSGPTSVSLTATDVGTGVLGINYSVSGGPAMRASGAGASIAAGGSHVLGLKSDGSVVATGGGGDVSGWSGVTALAAAGGSSVGLKNDGTVVAAGDNSQGQGHVSGWSGIAAVDIGNDPLVLFDPSSFTVGLKSDGTVVATGSNSHGQCDVSGWSGIKAVAAGGRWTLGLKSDGTAVGTAYHGDNDSWATYVSGDQFYAHDWHDLVAIDAGWFTSVGLKRDGTVVYAGGSSDHEQDVVGWSNIVSVKMGAIHTVGLKNDGTVVATGSNNYGQCNVSGWTDIVAIACGDTSTYGLRRDGTVVSTRGDLSSWRLRASVPSLSCNVPVGEGTTTIDYAATDLLGNASATQTVTARVDHTAPVSSADATAAYIETATISITAADAISAVASTHYRIDASEWTTGTVATTSAIGSHALEYYSVDLAGNREATRSASFAVLPTVHGSVAINAGASFTSTTTVSIDSSVAAAVQMRVRNTGGTWGEWMPYAESVSHTLSAGDGEKGVEVEYKDGSDRVWPLVDTIALDTTGPQGSVSVNDGAVATGSESVLLSMVASDGASVSQMRISSDGVFDSETWESFATGRVWELGGSDGLKTVYVQYRDSLGNVSAVYDAIALDRGAPAVSDDATAGWTKDSTGVGISATDTLSGIWRTEYTVNGVPGASGAGAQAFIDANTDFTVGLAPNGTVKIAGVKDNGRSDAEAWTGITAVANGQNHVVGLKGDGTVVAAGDDDRWWQVSHVATWTAVTAISANTNHTLGLMSDGTVADTLGYLQAPWTSSRIDCSGWRDIVAVSAGAYHDLGLKRDGTVVAAYNSNMWGQSNVETWTAIVGIAAGAGHSVGLKRDGTVVAAGSNSYGQCDVSDWHDIVAVSAGSNTTFGVKRDGTVVATGLDETSQCSDVATWTDIVAVAAGYYHTVGLKRDGTCVATRGTKSFAGPGGLGWRETEVDDWMLQSAATSTRVNVPVSAKGTTVIAYSAVDLAGNRCATQTVIVSQLSVLPAPTKLTLSAPSTCDYASVRLSGSLSTTAGAGVGSRPVTVRYSYDKSKWSALKTVSAGTGTFSISVAPTRKTYYQLAFGGDDTCDACVSSVVAVTPRVSLTKPSAPAKMRRTRSATVRGFLKPRHTSGTHSVRIYKYRYRAGKWVSYGYVKARVSSYPSYSKYAASVRLPSAGRWRLRAYHPSDSLNAATWSDGYDYVTVR